MVYDTPQDIDVPPPVNRTTKPHKPAILPCPSSDFNTASEFPPPTTTATTTGTSTSVASLIKANELAQAAGGPSKAHNPHFPARQLSQEEHKVFNQPSQVPPTQIPLYPQNLKQAPASGRNPVISPLPTQHPSTPVTPSCQIPSTVQQSPFLTQASLQPLPSQSLQQQPPSSKPAPPAAQFSSSAFPLKKAAALKQAPPPASDTSALHQPPFPLKQAAAPLKQSSLPPQTPQHAPLKQPALTKQPSMTAIDPSASTSIHTSSATRIPPTVSSKPPARPPPQPAPPSRPPPEPLPHAATSTTTPTHATPPAVQQPIPATIPPSAIATHPTAASTTHTVPTHTITHTITHPITHPTATATTKQNLVFHATNYDGSTSAPVQVLPTASTITLRKTTTTYTTTPATPQTATIDEPPATTISLVKQTAPHSTTMNNPPPPHTISLVKQTTPLSSSLSVSNNNASPTRKVMVSSALLFNLNHGVPALLGQGMLLEVGQTDETSGYVKAGELVIVFSKETPTLCASPLCYLFSSGGQYYMIKLSEENEEYLSILNACSAYHQPEVPVEKEVEGETENTKKAGVAASKIESGGTTVAQGLIKGASFLGAGIRKTSDVVINHTEKGNREVTEEERLRIEQQQKNTKAFLSGTRAVVGGIGKGASFVGRGIAKGVHKAKDMAGSEKKEEEEPEKENATKKAAVGVGTSTLHAFGSIKTGVYESVKIVSADVRDSSVKVTNHREGEEAAKLSEQQFNMAGQVAVGTIHTTKLMASTTLKVAVGVGAAAATYDKDWEKLLQGGTWVSGWLSSQDNTLDPWTSKWFVLRTYSLAMYKVDTQDPMKPVMYISVSSIKKVEPVDPNLTKRYHCFKIITKSSTVFLSADCSTDRPDDLEISQDEKTRRVAWWCQSLNTLAKICSGEVNV